MAKDFVTTIENFKGLDLKSSNLTTDLTTANSLLNLEFSESMSLRGRPGSQPVGQVGGFGGLHGHKYSAPTSGASSEQLLAANSNLWRLKSTALTVTGGANVNYQLTMLAATGVYRFVIQNNVTPYDLGGNNYYDLGTGLESEYTNTLKTVEDLRAIIDANATLACALPADVKFARVVGNQNNVSTIQVDPGHNYVVGDWMTFFDYNTFELTARKVSAVLVAPDRLQFGVLNAIPVTVRDNQVIGPMAVPAAAIRVRDVTLQTTEIPFEYWDLVPCTTDFFQSAEDHYPIYVTRNSPGSTGQAINFLDSGNDCYLYTSDSGLNTKHLGYPFKYDGQTVYREGIPKGAGYPTIGGAGPLNNGNYKYKIAYIQYDARGNIIQGRTKASTLTMAGGPLAATVNISNMVIANHKRAGTMSATAAGPINTIPVTSHSFVVNDWVFLQNNATLAYEIHRVVSVNSATSITISPGGIGTLINNGIYLVENSGFNYNYARVNGNQVNTQTITVYNTTAIPNTLRVGDSAYFFDYRVLKYTTRLVTGVTATTIDIAGDPVDVNVLYPDISNNLRAIIYRSVVGGNLYYLLEEVPHNPLCFEFTYTDSKSDAVLQATGAQLFEPVTGKEQDLPPRASIACNHQGTRCSSGDINNPNTVYVYSTLDTEAVPIASNSFDVPSSIKGKITGIISDGDDRLAIFKPNAYYQATGALDDNAFTVQTQSEGDRGVSSQQSLIRVNNKVVGIGPMGPISAQQGQILHSFSEPIYPAFAANHNVNYASAISVNDPATRSWVVFVMNGPYAADQGKYLFFSMDYGNNDQWFDRSFTKGADPAGGMTVYDDTIYFLSTSVADTIIASAGYETHQVFRRLRLEQGLTTPSNLYWDVNQPIPQVFEPSWLTPNDKISVDKEFQWFKLFCTPSPFELDKFTSFTPTLTTYKNYSIAAPVETLALSQLSTTNFETKRKLLATKMRSILFKVTLNVGGTAMFVTGFEPVVDHSYIQEQPR